MFYAGCGAYDVAEGKVRKGRALFARAVRIAEQHGLQGDLFDVLSLGALVLPAPEADRFAQRASAVRREFT